MGSVLLHAKFLFYHWTYSLCQVADTCMEEQDFSKSRLHVIVQWSDHSSLTTGRKIEFPSCLEICLFSTYTCRGFGPVLYQPMKGYVSWTQEIFILAVPFGYSDSQVMPNYEFLMQDSGSLHAQSQLSWLAKHVTPQAFISCHFVKVRVL